MHDTTLIRSSITIIYIICSHIPGLITVTFEVSGRKSPFSVSGVTVTVVWFSKKGRFSPNVKDAFVVL